MPTAGKISEKQIKALIELNEELENYFRNTIIPQLFVDADMILRKFTPPAMKQFDFSPDHIGRPVEDLVDNIRYSTIIDNIKEVIESEEILEKEIQTTDFRWFQMNIIPYIVQKNKKPNGVIITFIDITDRIKNLRELEKLNAAHETFIYSVSHDLKEPLANIEGLVLTLRELSEEPEKEPKRNKDDQKKVFSLLEKSVEAMRTQLEDLSEIAKIEGDYNEAVEPLNFEKLLAEVKMTLKHKLNEGKALITTDIKETKLNFSRKNLRSILYNLLSNAIKYQAPNRPLQVAIKTEKKAGFINITVTDNGIGIAKEQQEQLFTKFTRFEKDVEGTGLGLYLVKKIIENAGGKITVKSKVGKGSTFTVSLKHIKAEAKK